MDKIVDTIQRQLALYAQNVNYAQLPDTVTHTVKARVIDTFGALLGGFFDQPCSIVRNVAARLPDSNGASIIGTRIKAAPDMAAFANATAARFPELTDSYHKPASYGGHPSDVIMPVLAAAEHVTASGGEFIAAVALAYEIYLQLSDVFHNRNFDHTNFACLATAVAAGKLLRLSSDQLAQCVSMAIVPNNILCQVRTGHLSMYKAVSAGHAGRAGVFAALLAKAGMGGPSLPFEGQAGWCKHIARERFDLDALGDGHSPCKILETSIKNRPSGGLTISSILAAEKIAPLRNIHAIKRILVEIYKEAMVRIGTGEHRWNPDSKESADRSIPYVVTVTLMDGTITLRSYNDEHLKNPHLRALMQLVEVAENDEFTRAYDGHPQQHRTRVTVVMQNGDQIVGESGGDAEDMGTPKDDSNINEKFRGLAQDFLGERRVAAILKRLWRLETLGDVGEIARDFVLD